VPIVLFLDKEDQFLEKVTVVDIGIYHPLYTAGLDYGKTTGIIRFRKTTVSRSKLRALSTDLDTLLSKVAFSTHHR
jgi:hypothetical protein